jgi:hypothetical protein
MLAFIFAAFGAGDVGDVKKLALAVFNAGLAILGMVGKKKLDAGLPGVDRHRRRNQDLKAGFGRAIGDRINAAGEKPSATGSSDLN